MLLIAHIGFGADHVDQPYHAAQAYRISAQNGSKKQEDLAAHFGVPPSVAHRAEADVETLRRLWPHLLLSAGTTLEQLLASQTSTAVGMLTSLPGARVLGHFGRVQGLEKCGLGKG